MNTLLTCVIGFNPFDGINSFTVFHTKSNGLVECISAVLVCEPNDNHKSKAPLENRQIFDFFNARTGHTLKLLNFYRCLFSNKSVYYYYYY